MMALYRSQFVGMHFTGQVRLEPILGCVAQAPAMNFVHPNIHGLLIV